MSKYNIRYRTFDQLLDDVSVDFQNISLENFIQPQHLIKVAKRVNYDLGLKIFKTKDEVLELDKGRVRLPDDFYILNNALLCGTFTTVSSIPSGTHLEDRMITQPTYQCVPKDVDLCSITENSTPTVPSCDSNQPENNCGICNIRPCVRLNCKGEQYEVVQVLKFETREYKTITPLKIRSNPKFVDCNCPGLKWLSQNEIWIKDNFLYANFEYGTIYINYQGNMEDEEGNLLVPDHDLLNEYYEYALKQRILENLLMNDESMIPKLQLVEQRLRVARNNAVSMVNTPDFQEMKQVYEANRIAQYAKYYDMFKSFQNLGFSSKYL